MRIQLLLKRFFTRLEPLGLVCEVSRLGCGGIALRYLR